jgi:hypothetical protein
MKEWLERRKEMRTPMTMYSKVITVNEPSVFQNVDFQNVLRLDAT